MTLAAAVAHLQAGRPLLAVPILEAHLAGYAGDANAWFLLGACRHALKELPAAIVAFGRSIELAGDNPEAYLALATVTREAGDARAVLAACERGISALPAEPRLRHAAALALEDLGRHEEALARYEEALVVAPSAEDTLHNRGLLLARLGRLEEAEISCRAYATAYPRSKRARDQLADVLLARGGYDEVIALLGTAPDDALTLVRRGFALAAQGRFAEARDAFALARTEDAASVERFVRRVAPQADSECMLSPENIFIERCYAALCEGDWSRWEPMIDASRRAASAPHAALEPAVGFMVLSLPLPGSERHVLARRIAARIEDRVAALAAPSVRERARIRVGILSPDLREHLNAYLLLPLFELLDRRRFEICAYSLAPDDGSPARARVVAAADAFRDLTTASDDAAARLIRQDDIDILVDTAGYTTGARFAIMARRPARVHVNYLGFSCSLGSKRVDYAIVDRIAAGSAAEWSEALACVPHPYFLYDFRQRTPDIAISRRDYGLPEDAFVYCAFHRAAKISPDTFDAWMAILRRVPRSVLWLLAHPAAAECNLRQQASLRDVEPSRLIFAPFEPRHQPRYLARQQLGDLFLDARYHNAMTTACDALGAGLPLLTLPGEAIAARTAASLLHGAGLPELVVADRDRFIELAVRLAVDPALLDELRQRLLRNRWSAPLFDTAARVRSLEAAFERMHEQAKRGAPAASFDV
ncbi:MAG: O-linked N-acetylglucosamine transferase, SPINDLY family protein [Betaproteobacteria bacterium]